MQIWYIRPTEHCSKFETTVFQHPNDTKIYSLEDNTYHDNNSSVLHYLHYQNRQDKQTNLIVNREKIYISFVHVNKKERCITFIQFIFIYVKQTMIRKQ